MAGSGNASFQLLLSVFLAILTEHSLCLEATPTRPRSAVENFNITYIAKERIALLKFKQGLKDPSGRLSSWVGEDCCKWTGVGCSNQTGNVVKLDLGNSPVFYLQPCNKVPFVSFPNNLSCVGGEINPSLLNLTYLNYLSLRHNDFKGIPIPSFIGSLKNLRYLDLSHSSFGRMVPPSLGNLSNLIYLDLTAYSDLFEQIDRTPLVVPTTMDLWVSDLNWLSNLNSLQYLGLGGARLKKVTANWVHYVNMLPSLLELHFPLCGLTDLPQSLPRVNFTSLMVIDISDNNFENSSLPQWLFNISSLVTVQLSSNNFIGSISQFTWENLCAVQTLELANNFITGEINEFLDALSGCSNSSLEALDLSMNKLNGRLPDAFGPLTNLETLSLGYNSFSGPFPMSVVNLSKLSFVELSGNLLSGTIPESIGQLAELYSLKLWNNHWQGVVSESHLHNLTSLRDFSVSSKNKSLSFDVGHDWIPPFSLFSIAISDCQLSSSFPAWLRTQKEIADVIITDGALFGDIPDWIWAFSKLSWLDLSNNQLTGKLPRSIYLEYLDTVILDSNLLEGSLPFWPNVTFLFLGNNRFSGPIPLNISQEMPFISFLDLSRNYLNGSIPTSIRRMKNLRTLDLSHNNLTGNIPGQWSGLQLLWLLDLSNNNLSGSIPNSMCSQLPLLRWLRLSSNNFSGELNPSLKNCPRLITLDLGQNRFSGTIPEWIGENLTSMSYLILGANMFTGNLPEQLCQLAELQVLDLAHNNLSGPVPKCVGNLEAMKSAGSMSRYISLDQDLPDNQHLDLNVKGAEYEYGTLFWMVNSIDLSSNNLSGEIPEEVTKLLNLVALNLSRNQLAWSIPESIGSLRLLEALDLSMNHLSGPIPLSMTSMTFLSKLNLSYNNLSGPIPSTSQFQTFNDPTMYEGNLGLCGPPLHIHCSSSTSNGDAQVTDNEAADDEDESCEKKWLYLSIALGFIVGFWAVFGSLVIKRSRRHAYFQFLDKIKDELILVFARKTTCLRRSIEVERR